MEEINTKFEEQLARMRLCSGAMFAEIDKIERGAFVAYYGNQESIDSETSENMFIMQNDFEKFGFPEGNTLIEKYDLKTEIVICVCIMIAEDQAELRAEIIKPIMNESINNFISQNMTDKKNINNIKEGMITICAVCKKNTKKNCAKCKMTYYCCRAHQEHDWLTHKQYCKQLCAAKIENNK